MHNFQLLKIIQMINAFPMKYIATKIWQSKTSIFTFPKRFFIYSALHAHLIGLVGFQILYYILHDSNQFRWRLKNNFGIQIHLKVVWRELKPGLVCCFELMRKWLFRLTYKKVIRWQQLASFYKCYDIFKFFNCYGSIDSVNAQRMSLFCKRTNRG